MISDNALTYLSAGSEIEQLIKLTTVKTTLQNRGTTWQFIPWYGGFWKRLIGLTKTTMNKAMGRTCVSLIHLQTIVTEIEGTLNNRPLTYMSADVRDPEPLTPAHLLYGCQIVLLPHCTLDISDLDYGVATASNLQTRVS